MFGRATIRLGIGPHSSSINRVTRRPGSERARERGFHGEREGQGAKVPGSELARVLLADSLRGANWPGSEKAVNLSRQHFGQKLSQSNCVCKDNSKSKVGVFLRHCLLLEFNISCCFTGMLN